ncbi:hypothetical protein VAE063_940036 [Vibrio aestuarianus]|uniref:Acyltransferase n=1 Tax=Vibrio aestuarianus TaxID=28171 RepID=A0ABM9FP44_9VIBR|nr:hypothetical protein VAE063_940036 [Vibrio aestuarianus]
MATYMLKINQYWRVFATGFCFAIFGLGGLFLSFIAIPLISLFSRQSIKREYRVQKNIQFTFNLFCKLMKLTGAIDYKIDGADILKQDKNCLIVANHPRAGSHFVNKYDLIASNPLLCAHFELN